jgi:hypothetical protein
MLPIVCHYRIAIPFKGFYPMKYVFPIKRVPHTPILEASTIFEAKGAPLKITKKGDI